MPAFSANLESAESQLGKVGSVSTLDQTRNRSLVSTALNDEPSHGYLKSSTKGTVLGSVLSLQILQPPTDIQRAWSYLAITSPHQGPGSHPAGSPQTDVHGDLDSSGAGGLTYVNTNLRLDAKSKFNLKGDFLCRRLVAFAKQYNRELSDLHQRMAAALGSEVLSSPLKQISTPVPGLTQAGSSTPMAHARAAPIGVPLLSGNSTPQPHLAKQLKTLAQQQREQRSGAFDRSSSVWKRSKPGVLRPPPAIIVEEAEPPDMAKLGAKYVLASTVMDNLALIGQQSSDMILQKSMLSQLAAWLDEQVAAHLQDDNTELPDLAENSPRYPDEPDPAQLSLPEPPFASPSRPVHPRSKSVLTKHSPTVVPKNPFHVRNFDYLGRMRRAGGDHKVKLRPKRSLGPDSLPPIGRKPLKAFEVVA